MSAPLCVWPVCLPSLLQPQSALSCCLEVRNPNPYHGSSAAAPPGQVPPFCSFFVSGKFFAPEFLMKGGHSLRPVVFVSYSILRFLPMNISGVILFPYINTSSFSMLKLTLLAEMAISAQNVKNTWGRSRKMASMGQPNPKMH